MKRKPLVVLIADHDRSSRESLGCHLANGGYEVRSVASGEDAIFQCDVDPPNVLILDVNLPDLDGFEVCERIRHDTRDLDLTVILITDSDDDMMRCYLDQMVEYAGGDYFFVRPFDHVAIRQLIDDIGFVAADGRRRHPTHARWPTARVVV